MDVRSLVWSLSASDNATGVISGVNKETDKLKDNIAGTQKSFKDMNKGLGKVGGTLTKYVTLPLAGIATAGVKTVSSFDDAMSSVQAKTKATEEEFKALRDMAKDLGATTAHSARDAAEGMDILAASGMKNNEILEVTPGLLTLMSAGEVDANTAAKALTGTMAQFNMTADESNRIVDVFAKGAASANTNVSEMQEAFKMAGGDLANMNMDIEQSASMIGLLADANIVGSQAGTTLSAMAREIRANSDEFKELGINVYDSAGKMRDMGSILAEVESVTGNMTDAQRDAAMSTIFTGQAMRGVNAYLAQGSEAYKDLEVSIYDSEGAALDMANTMEDNIGGAFRSLKSAGEGFLIEVGDAIKGNVRDLADVATGLVRSFSNLDDGTKSLIVKVAGLAMAAGPLLVGFSKLAGFVTSMPAHLGVLKGAIGALTGPIGLTIGAVAGLIAVGVHLYKTNEEAREKIDAAWAGIKDLVSTGVQFVQGLWEEHGERIMNIVGVAWGHIQDTFMLGVDIVTGIVGMISSIISGDWAGVWDHAKGIVTSVFDYFAGLPAKLFDIGKNMVVSLGKGLKSVGTGVWNSTIGKIPGLSIKGSNAGGVNFVGEDGSVRKLHRREMVLTGDTADAYRGLGGSKDSLPDFRSLGSGQGSTTNHIKPEIHVTVQGNADKDTVADIGREVEHQLEMFFRKLNLQRG